MLTIFPHPHSLDVFHPRRTAYLHPPRNLYSSLQGPMSEISGTWFDICSHSVLTYRRVDSVLVLEAFVCCLTCFVTVRVSDAFHSVLTPFPQPLLYYGRVRISFPFILHSLTNLVILAVHRIAARRIVTQLRPMEKNVRAWQSNLIYRADLCM